MSKKLTVLLLLSAAIFVGITAFKPKQAPPGKWQNLKVLPQDISEDSLKAVMHFYSDALGVKCLFCHAMGDNGHPNFASDDKPEKNITRYMMKMTKEINAGYFNFKKVDNPDTIHVVTCYTCHHRNPHPEGIPPMDSLHQGMQPPPPGAPQGNMPPNGAPQGNMPPPGGMHDSTMHDTTMHKQ